MLALAKKKKQSTGFGRRLRELREAAELTQGQLAERCEMPYQMLAKYERGENEPTWPTVLKLAKALGVETNAFQVPVEDESPDPPVTGDGPPPKRPRKK